MKNLRATLKKFGQDALWEYFENAPADARNSLDSQLSKIDFEKFFSVVKTFDSSSDSESMSFMGLMPHPVLCASEVRSSANEIAGSRAFSAGEVAFFVVAGGQGSRLGFEHPKGMFPASPFGRSLFQIHFEKALSCGLHFGFSPHFLVMTSETNHQETYDYLLANNFFGLEKSKVHVFQQGTLPAIDLEGNLILADPGSLFLAPDGHGGSLAAIRNHGLIPVLKNAGVKYLSYFQVDNPLVNVADTTFVGAHITADSDMSSKVIKKRDPLEKLGNVAIRGGVPCVVEYSDLPKSLAESKTKTGELQFAYGSIGIHVFNLSFIEKVTQTGTELPFHRASKIIPVFNVKTQVLETPKKANGIKFEQFVFDAIPMTTKTIFTETLREDEFGPVKNREGEDSIASSKFLQSEFFKGWFLRSGFDVSRTSKVEIAPSFALNEKEFALKVRQFSIAIPKELFLG